MIVAFHIYLLVQFILICCMLYLIYDLWDTLKERKKTRKDFEIARENFKNTLTESVDKMDNLIKENETKKEG